MRTLNMGLRIGAAAVLISTAWSAVRSQDTASPKLASVAEAVALDPAFAARFGLCPADYFSGTAEPRGARPSYDDLDPGYFRCLDAPSPCLTSCREGQREDCFNLARVLKEREMAIGFDAEPSLRLYAEACSLGFALACTNRAAAALDGSPGDPLGRLPEPERTACAIPTFEATCAADDAWGCTMLGFLRAEGIGTAADPESAEELLRKACRLEPGADACTYARALLRELSGEK